MTELQEILQKLSRIESNLEAEISKLDNKIDLGFANAETKLAKIETRSATIEGKLNTQLITLGSKIDNLSERIKLIEVNAVKIINLAEKVGESKPWRIVQPFVTGFVTLLIGSWINWLLGVYQVVR